MNKLSVIIITFNEERNIARCLESVKEIADEILVVDSFSKDSTPEICKRYNTTFIQAPFLGYIEQKAFAVSKARYDHILSLDADEALSEQLLAEIKRAKENWDVEGYYMNRLTNYCGKWIKHCGWYPDKKLRLLNRTKGTWGGSNPHDRFEIGKGVKTGFLKGDILHYSYYSINEHVLQTNKFSTIASKVLYEKGKRFNALKLFTAMPFRFFRDYIIRGGFWDGYYGFIISAINAYGAFLKYAKLKDREND